MSFIASATCKFTDPELATRLFETAQDAWAAIGSNVFGNDALTPELRMEIATLIAEPLLSDREDGVWTAGTGHLISVTEVEAYEVADTYGLNFASEDEQAMVGERVYWVKRVGIWTDVDGNEADWVNGFNLRKL